MKHGRRRLVPGVIGILMMIALLLVPANFALARSHFFFGLNLGVPLGPYPYPAYTYPYAPPPVYYPYPAAPYSRVYPPCARAWVPGYYDGYGNWVFGYYRYDCGSYGY